MPVYSPLNELKQVIRLTGLKHHKEQLIFPAQSRVSHFHDLQFLLINFSEGKLRKLYGSLIFQKLICINRIATCMPLRRIAAPIASISRLAAKSAVKQALC